MKPDPTKAKDIIKAFIESKILPDTIDIDKIPDVDVLYSVDVSTNEDDAFNRLQSDFTEISIEMEPYPTPTPLRIIFSLYDMDKNF